MKWLLSVLLVGLLPAMLLVPIGSTAQTCNPSIAATSHEAGFSIHGDGTATHQPTGLMWMRCGLGQNWNGKTCDGEALLYSWSDALQTADRSAFAAYSDWRLPGKNELETLIEESCHSPAISERVFPETSPAYYWTSSPYAGLAHGAWSIDFGYGSVNASVKSGSLNVRLVRGGRD